MKNRSNTSVVSGRKLLACCFLGMVSLTLSVVLLAIDPLPIVARKYTQISPGSFVTEFLKKKINGIQISLYIFNITNAEDFMSGKDHKLKMEHVGPFTYREVVHIDNMELDEEAGVMRYSPRLESVFVPEESIGQPEDIMVTVPNMALLGVTSMISSYPYFIRMAYNLVVKQQRSRAIRTLDARSFMWGTPDPFLSIVKNLVPGLVNYDRIAFFDFLYQTKIKNNLVVGATETDKFMIKTRNGYRKLMMSELQDMETCKECDTFNNTYEGMMYPAPVRPDTPIRLFRTGFCKIVDMVYRDKRVVENGIEGLVFRIPDSFFSKGSIDGLMDLSPCVYGFPITVSKLHFLGVDPELYERVDVTKSDRSKNTSYDNYLVIEPITGVELDTYGALQVSLPLKNLTFNSETKRFSNMLVPSSYAVFKQQKLDEEISSVLKSLYVTLPLLLLVTRIVLFLLAFIFLAYPVRLLYCYKSSSSNLPSSPISTKIDEKSRCIKIQEPLISN